MLQHSWIPNKPRMILWRITQYGFFTNSRALRWLVSDGICMRCGIHVEMIEHLFFDYHNAKRKWREIKRMTKGSNLSYVIQNIFFVTIAQVIRRSKRKPSVIIMIGEVCNMIWLERNVFVYSRTYSRVLTWTIITQVKKSFMPCYPDALLIGKLTNSRT